MFYDHTPKEKQSKWDSGDTSMLVFVMAVLLGGLLMSWCTST